MKTSNMHSPGFSMNDYEQRKIKLLLLIMSKIQINIGA